MCKLLTRRGYDLVVKQISSNKLTKRVRVILEGKGKSARCNRTAEDSSENKSTAPYSTETNRGCARRLQRFFIACVLPVLFLGAEGRRRSGTACYAGPGLAPLLQLPGCWPPGSEWQTLALKNEFEAAASVAAVMWWWRRPCVWVNMEWSGVEWWA